MISLKMKALRKMMVFPALIFGTSLVAFADSDSPIETFLGKVLLDGKEQQVKVENGKISFNEAKIVIGSDEYVMSDRSSQSFGGRRIVRENGKTTVDVSVEIDRQPEAIKEAIERDGVKKVADEAGLVNGHEVKCEKSDNAFIWVSDNISGRLVGNCLTLTKKVEVSN